MNKVLFNTESGVAGDMMVGCLVDAGADQELILSKIRDVLKGFCEIDVCFKEAKRNSISSIKFEVMPKQIDISYNEILYALKKSGLTDAEKNCCIDILDVLRDAEAAVHGDSAGFHEVGQVDAVADIVGSVAGFYDLGLDKKRVFSLPVRVGGGYVDTAHGRLSVPTPATAEILRGCKMVWSGGPVNEELLTPTGAAILSVFVDEFVSFPPEMKINEIGKGAGSKELDVPNILSVYLGESEGVFFEDSVGVLETNIDDVDGETIGYLKNRLLEEGVLDVSVVPTFMKKDRPGFILKVIVEKEDINKVSEIIVRETGTLGVRVSSNQHRFVVERDIRSISIFGREVSVKVGRLRSGEVIDVSAEYEDCREVADETGRPLKEIKKLVEARVLRDLL